MHILLIDNNAFVAGGYKAMLQKEGYNVTFEQHGVHAIERMKELHPDVVLLDLGMPGKDGFEILEERWQDPNLRAIPVIVVSSLEQKDLQERLKELHADDYMHKLDVQPAELIRRVKSLVVKK